jgi:hypothetical protein
MIVQTQTRARVLAGLLLALCGALALLALARTSPALASFGINNFDVTFTEPDGSPTFQAGAHPYAMTTSFGLNKIEHGQNEVFPDQAPKELRVELPPGFVGDPLATPRCSNAEFADIIEVLSLPSCSNSTAVGIITVEFAVSGQPGPFTVPVYNLVPPPGVVNKLGFVVLNVPVTIEVFVNPNPPYNVIAESRNITQTLNFFGAYLRLWGDPADPAHDTERGSCVIPHEVEHPLEVDSGGSCPVSIAALPFLTLPTECESPPFTTYQADSWQEPEAWVSGSVENHDGSNPPAPLALTGCSGLAFTPSIDAKPTTAAAESPSGLNFTLDVQNPGLTSPVGISQSDIKKVVVTLPEAMSVNPALAEGLAACSEADLARETVSSAPGEGCPQESKIGTVEVQTPLLEQTLTGELFLATPYANPFGSLIALYVVIRNPETGVLLKLPGKVVPNETTGQLVSVFDNLPQLPFSHFRLSFRAGQRSPLVTPPACGTYTSQAALTPWAEPASVLHDSATFTVSSGIDGAPCPAGGVAPFKPSLVAGTQNNAAGSYSPLDIDITRGDGEQEITGFATQLPAGLTANLTGVQFCGEAQIAAARGKSGTEELANPSCPQASEIGHTLVGVGVGSVLAYTSGKLYMAGPFEGASFSVVSITSAKVGPFDLGTVVVHLPLSIDPLTGAVSIPTGQPDQIPHLVKGIVVHVRDIRVYVDRPDFTLNPTSCAASSLGATVIGSGASFADSSDDVPVALTDPFQAANCANLAFKPAFQASTSGKSSKANGASLTVKLTYPKAPQGTQANIRRVKVDLPKQLPSRLTTLQQACTSAQFHLDPAGCPAASVVGHARAYTPILPVPLEGPAYFVSNGSEAFPNLIMVLQGYGVTIDLTGDTFISKAGVTSSTFPAVPDQPVTSFELTLPEGPYSALATDLPHESHDLCGQKLTMPTEFIGQNGVEIRESTPIAVEGCAPAIAVVSHTVKGKTATIHVSVPAPGKLVVVGRGLSKASKTATGATTLTVRLNLTNGEAAALSKHKGRKLKAKLNLTFTPKKGEKLKTSTTVVVG